MIYDHYLFYSARQCIYISIIVIRDTMTINQNHNTSYLVDFYILPISAGLYSFWPLENSRSTSSATFKRLYLFFYSSKFTE